MAVAIDFLVRLDMHGFGIELLMNSSRSRQCHRRFY